jgi:hypothetical protein
MSSSKRVGGFSPVPKKNQSDDERIQRIGTLVSQLVESWSARENRAEAFTRKACVEKLLGDTSPSKKARMVCRGGPASMCP